MEEIQNIDYYVAGIVDGEGSIGVHIQKSSEANLGVYLSPRIRIPQEDDNEEFFNIMDEYTSSISVNCSPTSRGGGMRTIVISGIDNCFNFLYRIEDKVVIKSKQVDIMLEEILPKMGEGLHTNKKGLLKILGPIEELHEMKGKGNEMKYTRDYFEDLWDMELNNQVGITEW